MYYTEFIHIHIWMCICMYITRLWVWDYNIVQVAQMAVEAWTGKLDLSSNPDSLTYTWAHYLTSLELHPHLQNGGNNFFQIVWKMYYNKAKYLRYSRCSTNVAINLIELSMHHWSIFISYFNILKKMPPICIYPNLFLYLPLGRHLCMTPVQQSLFILSKEV